MMLIINTSDIIERMPTFSHFDLTGSNRSELFEDVDNEIVIQTFK